MMNNVLEMIDYDNCCGCGACSQSCNFNAINMIEDKYGFTIPTIDDEKCIACGKCINTCTVINSSINLKYPLKVYAAINLNDDELLKSSSGGIFSLLANKVISENGIVYGAAFTEDFKVKHISIIEKDNLDKIMRSKYVQSSTVDIYKSIKSYLRNKRTVLFSGTPCQVNSVYCYLKNEDISNLITVDIVCHGVPSQHLFDDYLSCLNEKYGKIDKYEFRFKRKPQNGMNWFSSFSLKGKRYIINWPEDSYNYYYMKAKTYRKSCYTCKFARLERIGDLTLCDYWHWEEYHSKDFSPNSSVSGILINTEKGKAVFDKVKDKLITVESNINYISKNNSCLLKPIDIPLDRDKILNDWIDYGYSYINSCFKRKYRKQILKYRFLRNMPSGLVRLLKTIK